ncbi:SIMPL domain-containing protein [Sulfitobacter mediterraneus]|uniref:SIMPL domain-containing protein n=1 Tax=Sulfitobacter mediterraneus TaxID=83219 RepID=UPI0021A64673|nr:SIMPL domain-containing protein [Sulfitobacter mediterraneus]UWR10172.1 SIMPL domain-containing protein [Sulfitobacter mediterraneus]
MRWINWAAVIWLLVAPAAWAQATTEAGIIVTGEGRVAVAPDMAAITLGVRHRGDTAQEAMALVTDDVAGILNTLTNVGIANTDQQTSGFYLRPVYNSRGINDGTPPDLVGYEAGNTVTVWVRDLAVLGSTLDAVIEIGANEFNGLRFDLQDPSAAQSLARQLAVGDARAKAEELAQAAGVALGPLVRLSEAGSNAGPRMMEMSAGRASMDSAIASGEVGVEARVTLVFEIRQP